MLIKITREELKKNWLKILVLLAENCGAEYPDKSVFIVDGVISKLLSEQE